MSTSNFYTYPEGEAALLPGEALLNCNGQDITKKGTSKGRNRILTVFPAHLGLPSKMPDCVLGNIRKLNSDAPEFVINTEQGELVFEGKFEFPSTKFLSIACQPSTAKRVGQSALTDVFDRILVFSEPTLRPAANGSVQSPLFRAASINSTVSDIVASQSSELEAAGAVSSAVTYSAHFGVSSTSDPVRAATAKRLGGSATKASSSSTKNPSSTQKSGSPKKRSRKAVTESESEGEDSDGDSQASSGSTGTTSHMAVDDSASDVEEELGSFADSPVDRRSSSRRASASKAVSYREDEGEEEDERSYSTSGSGSTGASSDEESGNGIKDMDIMDTSDDEVQIVSKPSASKASASKATGSAAKPKATPAPKSTSEKTKPAPKPRTAPKSDSKPPKAAKAKAPVARKLATSSGTKRKSGYFSDESDEESVASDASGASDGASSSDLSPVQKRASARPRAARQVIEIDSSEGGSESDGSEGSEESDFLFGDSASSKKRTVSTAAKPVRKTEVKPKAAKAAASPAKRKAPSAGASASAKKQKVADDKPAKSLAKSATKSSKTTKTTKAPAKRASAKKVDADDVISIEDSDEPEDSDEDYSD